MLNAFIRVHIQRKSSSCRHMLQSCVNMDEFGVFAVFGENAPPQKLLSSKGESRVCVAVPASVRQVVLFSSGRWEDRICVNAELDDSDKFPITIGKLTPYNKCLSWEQWEEETWTHNVTLNLTLEGGNRLESEPPIFLTVNENTPKDSSGPQAVLRELNSKRKRLRETEDEETDENAQVKITPIRRMGGHTKKGQKLFASGADVSKGEEQAVMGKTPPSAAKTKTRSAKTPTINSSLVVPSGRWGQTLCPIDAQTAILIGGQGSRMQFCKDPMWKLCTEDMSWVAAETLAEGPTPEARIGHTAVYDPDSKRIFVFGGSKNKKWFNDVHILDTQSWKWSMVEAQGKVPPLAYHTCSMFRGELFVLGGVFPRPNPEPDCCSDSLYIFDPTLSIWYQPIVTGDMPSPRSGHSACVMQQRKIYMFGGWDTPVCYNDMYMLDLGLMEFSSVETSGSVPSPRSWHGSAVLSETKFLIHGGYNGSHALSDAFIFDTEYNTWTTMALPQLSLPRAGHSIITMETTDCHRFPGSHEGDDTGNRRAKTLLVFGGGDNEGNFYCDLTTVAVDDLVNWS
ncbi:kelch repeat-containing protein isoform X2 [Synchiropus splendidus]|uniref:kelch repeat-containing protein isoform X2 n=1 Tax=Synchiropus splendidus TaxID=270530 RepID=UPI00237D4E6E|nr:kelch repeat-containing protein isoform X2 [Synchiropus splendidus]